MKTCTKCNIKKPFEAFYKSKKKKDGYHYSCIECEKSRRLELKKNPLMQLEKQIRSSIILENKLLKREGKKLCGKCNEIFSIDDLESGRLCKNCRIEYLTEYYLKNKDKLNEKWKEYREENKDKIKEKDKKRREKNKDKIREYQRQYWLKKKLEKENQTDDFINQKG